MIPFLKRYGATITAIVTVALAFTGLAAFIQAGNQGMRNDLGDDLDNCYQIQSQ